MAGPKDELRAAIDGLSDEQVQTMLGWAGVLRRDDPGNAGGQSLGALGDVLGMIIESREAGRSRMRLTVDPAWYNPHGVLHGGVIYIMVDSAMGTAVSSGLRDGELCTTIDVSISYLASVREGTLVAEANVVKLGRNIAFIEAKVTDDKGKLVATATGSMFIVRAQQ